MRQLERARRQVQGLKVQTWQIGSDGVAEVQAIADSILTWCRESMAACRRPYGVDHFDLAIAVRDGDDVRNVNFSKLRVKQLYEDDFSDQLRSLLALDPGATVRARHIAVGLFSWGDALHQALASQDATA